MASGRTAPAARALLCLTLLTGAARAEPDGALDQRVNHVTEQLRCLVCQNQTIADSHAQLALELKKTVREQLGAGRTEAEVIDFMVQRYGDFVLYRPPFKPSTWLLWLAPALLLGGGVLALLLTLRWRRAALAPVSADERARGAALLAATTTDKEAS